LISFEDKLCEGLLSIKREYKSLVGEKKKNDHARMSIIRLSRKVRIKTRQTCNENNEIDKLTLWGTIIDVYIYLHVRVLLC